MNTIVSDLALKDSTVRLFPVSKNRSRRIHKKLVKRFGGEFRKEPCAYQTPQGLIVHPALYVEFQRKTALKRRDAYEHNFYGKIY
jgi:hypothetical protein